MNFEVYLLCVTRILTTYKNRSIITIASYQIRINSLIFKSDRHVDFKQ